ncbi:hypothetical protein IP83_10525 [Novosphingobium sp. AAP93]|nr:hypothetical protein IP83_10525 [Novosphingobium sp. AAP93]
MTHEEAMHRADPNEGAVLDKPRLNLDEGHVALLGDQSPNEAAVRFDPARMPVATARLGDSPAMFQRKSVPADRTRHADPEAGRRRMATQAAVNRGNNSVPKIL